MVKTVAFFNPTKTECLTSSNKVKKPFHPSLIFNNVQLKEDETHKHLRVILSCNLSRNLHLDQIVFFLKGLLTSQYAAKILKTYGWKQPEQLRQNRLPSRHLSVI